MSIFVYPDHPLSEKKMTIPDANAVNMQRITDALNGDNPEQKLIAETFLTVAATCLRKNADYGSCVFAAPQMCPEVQPEVAIRVRLSDKISRLQSLRLKGKSEVDESVLDTMTDLGVYAILNVICARLAMQ